MVMCRWWKGWGTRWLAVLLTNLNIILWKKNDVIGNNKSLRLHLNARDFSQHKSKMSAGWSEAVQLRVCGYLEQKNCRFSPPRGRPTLTTNQKEIKSYWQKIRLTCQMYKLNQLLVTFTPYGGSSNVTSMYLSPLLAGSRARSCQKKKTKTTYINFDQSCPRNPKLCKGAYLLEKSRGKIILYLHKDLNRAFSNVQIRRTQISALIHRGGRV